MNLECGKMNCQSSLLYVSALSHLLSTVCYEELNFLYTFSPKTMMAMRRLLSLMTQNVKMTFCEPSPVQNIQEFVLLARR